MPSTSPIFTIVICHLVNILFIILIGIVSHHANTHDGNLITKDTMFSLLVGGLALSPSIFCLYF